MSVLGEADEASGVAAKAARERNGRGDLAAGDQEFIHSLAKGLAVIEAFSESAPQMTLSEVSRRVGLSPGSARRVLRTLHLLGYASCTGKRFELTPRVLQLGYSFLTSLPAASLVRPRLTELTEEIGANCAVSVLDGTDIVFVARTTAKSTARERLGVGARFPAHTTSAGKVLLADLDRDELAQLYDEQDLDPVTPNTVASIDALYEALEKAREDGWALNDQEAMVGHRSISVPVRIDGRAVASVGAGAHVGVANVAKMVSFLPALRAAADDIAGLLREHATRKPAGGRRPRPRLDIS